MNDNPRTIRPMKCSGSDEMQLVMKSGEVLESKSVWHPIKCSHSGISCGTMYGQSCIGQFRSLKTVRQSNFRIDSDAFVPSYPCSRATSQNFIQLFSFCDAENIKQGRMPIRLLNSTQTVCL